MEKKKYEAASSSKNHLEIKLEEFVSKFVKEFEAKLTSYALILDGVTVKSGSMANSYAEKAGQGFGLALGGTLGLSVGLPGPGASAGKAVVGAIAKGIGNRVGRDHHQNKVTQLSELIYHFEQNRTEFRKMLVKVGLDIFQSFEMQFGRMSSDLGERGAMNKLAIDAMNRAIEYIARTTDQTQLDHHSLILEGVKLGQSKGEPVMGKPVPGRHNGFEIIYHHESKEIKWTSASLYSKVGIVIINKGGRTFYHSKNGKSRSAKYGFRRCFTREKWEELAPLYKKTKLWETHDKFVDYYYSSDIVETMVSHICQLLESERDQTLGIDRINILLNETKDEILEKLRLLKPIYNKMEVESKILLNIESDLKNLNLEEYCSKFNLKMDKILDEISKGTAATCSKLDEINFSLGELKYKVDNLSQVSDVAISSRNFIWFDVRRELVNFTGREAILDQIEGDLKNGPVVILCGLGGIGKSELAVKYAHSKYDQSDNVIWVNADTLDSIAASIWQLAQALKVNELNTFDREKDLNLVIPEIYKIIFNRKCLLIVDNAKHFSEVEPLLRWSPSVVTHSQPPKVIVTSRNSSEWESARFSVKIIHLDVFERSEAIDFVNKTLSLENDFSDIDQLINVLGNFPLALQHAVTNIKITNSNFNKRNKQFTIKNFLDKFSKEPEKSLSCKLPLDMYGKPSSVFLIVSFTVKDLVLENELGENARLILRMASYLAPDNIREEFFLDEFDDEDELIEVMNLLENYALVKIHDEKLIIHRLVQQAIRFNSEKEEEFILKKDLNLLMNRLKNLDSITFCTPHIVSVWEYASNHEKLIEEFIINSSNKFYIYSSFLQTLVQRNKVEIVKKILDAFKNNFNSNKLSDILRKLFEDKSAGFEPVLTCTPEMIQLLEANGVEMDYNPALTLPTTPEYSSATLPHPRQVTKKVDHTVKRPNESEMVVDQNLLGSTNNTKKHCTIL